MTEERNDGGDGRSVTDYSPRELAHKIAYIAQSHQPAFPFRVLDVATMGRTSRIGYLSSPGREEQEAAMEHLRYLSGTRPTQIYREGNGSW